MESAKQVYVVLVFKTEGIGFEQIVGPFTTREEAVEYRDRYPLASVAPVTEPER